VRAYLYYYCYYFFFFEIKTLKPSMLHAHARSHALRYLCVHYYTRGEIVSGPVEIGVRDTRGRAERRRAAKRRKNKKEKKLNTKRARQPISIIRPAPFDRIGSSFSCDGYSRRTQSSRSQHCPIVTFRSRPPVRRMTLCTVLITGHILTYKVRGPSVCPSDN
jgi:hypothetical protein